MSVANLNLGYCIDNVKTAEALEGRLKNIGFPASHFYGKADQAGGSLAEQLLGSAQPILLLISDNFLKSVSCMSGSLQLLQRKKEAILPVIIDGVDKTDPQKTVHTQFERVSDIIQYINYWQEQYLDLRRQKRQMELDNEEAFHRHLREVRSISGEAGEFLRLLRHMTFYRLEDLEQDNFQALFQFLGKEQEWEAKPSASSTSELKGQESNLSKTDPVPTADIPGIDLLEGKSLSDNPVGFVSPKPDPAVRQEAKRATVYDPEEQQKQIQRHLAENRLDDAIKLIDESLKMEPRSPKLFYQKALLLSRMDGRKIEALATLDELLQVRPVHVEGRFLRAELEEWRQDYHRARHDYEQVLELDPDHPTASFRLGRLLAKHFPDEPLEAARILKKAMAKDPANTEAIHQYAKLLKKQLRQPELAIPFLEKITVLEPDNGAARMELAETLHSLDRKEEALEAYLAATRLDVSLKNEENDQRFKIEPPAQLPDAPPEEEVKSSIFSVDEPSPAPEWESPMETPPISEPEPPVQSEPIPPVYSNDNGVSEPEYKPEPVQEPTEPTPASIEEKEQEMDRMEQEILADSAEMLAGLPDTDQTDPEGNLEVIQQSPEEDNTINALKDNLKKLELLLAERRRREQEALEALKEAKTDALTVFITGATSGIGKATAQKFAENGYRVIITGRRNDRLMALKDHFEEEFEHADVYPLPFDVRDLGSIQLALNRLPSEWKDVDILINNAGKAKGLAPIHEGNIDHWNEMIDTNLKGLLYLTRAISPGMVERGRGQIINVGSTAGKEVYPNGGVYCATKFAVDALTKAMRLDFHKYGIRVGQVSPGHVEETEFALVRFDGDQEKAKIYEDFQPLKASDVAEAIYFLASQPAHVNVQDVLMMSTQQASATMVDRSGRKFDREE